jgi:hypothetical protein
MIRRVRLFAVLGVLLALVAWVGLDIWAGRRVEAEYLRLEKKYGSLDGRSVVAHAVDPEYNSARFMRAAADLAVRYHPPTDFSFGVLLASFKRFEELPQSANPPEALRAFLEANRDAMRLADEARTRHQASWGADHGVSGGADMPSFLQIRTVSNALYFAALLDVKAARPDEAAQQVAGGLAVASSIRNEPALIAQLIRISIATQQCDAIERLIARSEPSKAALEELARALVENTAPDPVYAGILAELRIGNTALLRMERGERTFLSEYANSRMWAGPLLARIGRPFLRIGRVHYLQDMERLLEVLAGPRPRQASQKSARLWEFRRLAPSYSRGLERAADSGDDFVTVMSVTQVGVALRRYRLDHGSYPDDLSALVPAYLSRVPKDAVTGRPPVYMRRGAGFTLKGEAVRTGATNPALEWTVDK